MSIRNRLILVFTLGTLVLIAVMVIASIWIDRLARDSQMLAESMLPLQNAAHEMEINVHEAAQAVTAYASSGGATVERKARIRDSLDDFETFAEIFFDRADSVETREFAIQIATQFREFVADAELIVQRSDAISVGVTELRRRIAEVDRNFDEDLEAILETTPTPDLEKVKATLEMEINAVEIFKAIKDYLVQPNSESQEKIEGDLSDFRSHRGVFYSQPNSDQENEWLRQVDAAMASALELGRTLMQQSDDMQSLLAIMQSDLRDIDSLLDDRLQVAVAEEVAELSADSQKIRVDAFFALAITGLFAAAFAVGSAIYTARSMVTPLQRLSEAAAQIGRGRFSVTVPGEGRDEIGVLAAAMRRMLADLKETTVRRSHLYLILSSLSESVMVVSPDGLIISANEATIYLTGFKELDLIGLPLRDLIVGAEIDLSPWRNGQARRASQGIEAAYRSKDGRDIPILLSISPMVDENGALESFVVTGVDNSIQHEARNKLARSNEELERFAYIASHDLQEPLRMVSSFTQLLQQKYSDALDQTAQDYITFAADGAQRMRHLINDLLAYSRIGRTERPLVDLDCAQAVETACSNLAVTMEDSGAKVTWHELPMVRGDVRLLESLFQNLISNAIKYRRETVPEITVSARREGTEIVISIKDNGIGIEERFLSRIFEPFQRLHSREEYEGTGIGLAICKRIVELHGGRIWAESQPGVGTTVSFTLRTENGVANGKKTVEDRQYLAG